MNLPPTPHRRWYQFSLRTMLVGVTVAAAGFGLAVRWVQNSREWIRQRNEIRNQAWSSNNPKGKVLIGVVFEYYHHKFPPGGLWLLGEEPVPEMWVSTSGDPDEHRELMKTLKSLFPEAFIREQDYD